MTPTEKKTMPPPRRSVAAMSPYVPGEQPKIANLIKLNTNENPYAPSPRTLEALAAVGEHALRKYPDPMAVELREAIAGGLGLGLDQVIAGNGSDEILKMFVEAFVEPGEKVAYLWPTYSLYPVFVQKQEAVEVRLPWRTGQRSQEEALTAVPADVKLLFATNPNPPIGLGLSIEALESLAAERPGMMLVVDEAYIAYGGHSALSLVLKGLPNVAVTRTFSKSHSLAGMRVGFGFSTEEVVDMLFRVKDSYNLNVAAQHAALAAWNDATYTEAQVARIRATRGQVFGELQKMGLEIEASEGNFLFARHERARHIYSQLRQEGILVRYFDTPELRDGIRVTIGTEDEMTRFLETLARCL